MEGYLVNVAQIQGQALPGQRVLMQDLLAVRGGCSPDRSGLGGCTRLSGSCILPPPVTVFSPTLSPSRGDTA